MNTTATATVTAGAAGSAAKSSKLRAFAGTFGITGVLGYLVCLWWNLPMFTYHPAVGKAGWGWEAAVNGEGPSMYWFGWTANVLVVATILGLVATLLPDSVTRKIPLSLVWILPIISLPILIYTLLPLLNHP
jgi:hypothetical protein